jgi:hypothetical protein
MLFVTGCVYDEGGSVSVSSGYTGYSGYDDDYLDDGPYYSYSGRRYYSSGGRYRYYEGRRPIYVTQLPRGASYIESGRRRSDRVVVSNYRSRPSSDYGYQSQRRFDDSRSDYRSTDRRSDFRRPDRTDIRRSDDRRAYDRRSVDRRSDDRQDQYVAQVRRPQTNVRVRTSGDQVRVSQRAGSNRQAVIVKERKKKRDND